MNVLLDSSFLIDLLNELANSCPGPACQWLRSNPRARLWVSPVSVAEILEGAQNFDFVNGFLRRFRWQGIHRTHAARAALIQSRSARRMGENDVWQAAIAIAMHGKIVGHDPKAFERLGDRYIDHRVG